MKLQQKHRQMIALGCGGVLILMGALQGIFHINISKEVSDMVSFNLMIIAAFMVLSGRNKKGPAGDQNKPDDNDSSKIEEESKIQIEENKPSDN